MLKPQHVKIDPTTFSHLSWKFEFNAVKHLFGVYVIVPLFFILNFYLLILDREEGRG